MHGGCKAGLLCGWGRYMPACAFASLVAALSRNGKALEALPSVLPHGSKLMVRQKLKGSCFLRGSKGKAIVPHISAVV